MMNQIVAEIIVTVAERYGFTYADILGPRRTAMVVRAREQAMLESRRMGFSYTELGSYFGKHHTTVLEACRRAEGRVA